MNGEYKYTLAGAEKTLTFTEGKATVKLKKDQEIEILNLPNGASYEITEAETSGYVTSWKDGKNSGTVSKDGETPELVCVNEHNAYGNMTIQKLVKGNAKDGSAKFDIAVKAWTDSSKATPIADGKYGSVTFTNGEASEVKLGDGESVIIENLPYGAYYEVTEANAGEYEATAVTKNGKKVGDVATTVTPGANNKSVTVTGCITDEYTGDKLLVVTITNTKDRFGGFKLTKELKASDGGEVSDALKARKFRFTVTLTDTSINGQYGGASFTNGVATVELTHEQSVSVYPLAHGTGYTITEEDYSDDGITAATNPIRGSVVGTVASADDVTAENLDNVNQVTAKNTYSLRGTLNITKLVDGNMADKVIADNTEFTIQVKLEGDAWKNTENGATKTTFSDVEFDNTTGIGEFRLKGSETKSIANIPNGTRYKVSTAWWSPATTVPSTPAATTTSPSPIPRICSAACA